MLRRPGEPADVMESHYRNRAPHDKQNRDPPFPVNKPVRSGGGDKPASKSDHVHRTQQQ